ncbi:MAG: methyltransferase domain-containing protein, partial [Reyranella sp.]|uniref:class I SAM-dependent methyltransferase n=1 Tax=Reyranella sp. TaxID=1929291 RepID=UPI001229923A
MAADEKMIWDRYANWESVSSSDDLSFVKQRITGRKVGWWEKNQLPAGFEDALVKLGRDLSLAGQGGGTVLDFGCGLGRNVEFLRSRFSRVIGLDLPRMIENLRKDPIGKSYDALYDDRSQLVSSEDINVIYDSVVLQHIKDLEYNKDIVKDFNAMTNLRFIISLAGGWGVRAPQTLLLLKDAGWTEVFSVQDGETFRKPHMLTILKHPSVQVRQQKA